MMSRIRTSTDASLIEVSSDDSLSATDTIFTADSIRVVPSHCCTFHVHYSARKLPPHATLIFGPISLSESTLDLMSTAICISTQGIGIYDERCNDLIAAACEAGQNAISHGKYPKARVGLLRSGGVQVLIHDIGEGIKQVRHAAATDDSLLTASDLGKGFEAMQVVDRVWVASNGSGTTIVLEQDRIRCNEE